MSNEFQWIVDNAVDISINKRAVVAQTISRDQTIRATSRGGRVWRFTITPSPGQRWSTSRSFIEAIDKADRIATTTINFAQSAFAYLFGYQGNATSFVGMQAVAIQGSDTIQVTGGTIVSGFKFKAGDLVQFTGQKRVYSVVADVAWDATTVQLNRPVLEASDTYALTVGATCEFSVICATLPEWTIVTHDRIEWSGPFVLIEALA